jgi:hypothetical protein
LSELINARKIASFSKSARAKLSKMLFNNPCSSPLELELAHGNRGCNNRLVTNLMITLSKAATRRHVEAVELDIGIALGIISRNLER